MFIVKNQNTMFMLEDQANGKNGDRIEVIQKFEEYLKNSPDLLDDLGELK